MRNTFPSRRTTPTARYPARKYAFRETAFFRPGEVFVPADFVTEYMDGITVEADSAKRTVKISRNKTEETDADGKFTDAAVTFHAESLACPVKAFGKQHLGYRGHGKREKGYRGDVRHRSFGVRKVYDRRL